MDICHIYTLGVSSDISRGRIRSHGHKPPGGGRVLQDCSHISHGRSPQLH